MYSVMDDEDASSASSAGTQPTSPMGQQLVEIEDKIDGYWDVELVDPEGVITKKQLNANEVFANGLPDGLRIILFSYNGIKRDGGPTLSFLGRYMGPVGRKTYTLPIHFRDWRLVDKSLKKKVWDTYFEALDHMIVLRSNVGPKGSRCQEEMYGYSKADGSFRQPEAKAVALRKLEANRQSSQSSQPSGSSTSRLSEVEYERLRAEMDERMHTEIERRMAEYKTQMDAQLQTQLFQMMAQFSSTPPVPPATVPRDEFCGFHPALFEWPEITNAFSNDVGTHGEDKPQIVARVFRMKLLRLKKDIDGGKYFGKTVAGMHTVEFQKRGLPHVHILVWLRKDSKLETPFHIDRVICVELPNPNSDPVGYAAVTRFMLHGPCGKANPMSPCMVDGKFKKISPKKFSSETTFDDNGYDVYRRRDTGVVRLCIHLEGQQPVSFGASQPVQSIVGRPGIENTMLTQWFSLNRRCPSTRKYTYDQISNAFVFNDNCKDWAPRKKGFVVGRIPTVPAAAGDIFYLRILLGKQWWESMAEDFVYRQRQLLEDPTAQPCSRVAYNEVLRALENLLHTYSSSLAHYNLPLPTAVGTQDPFDDFVSKHYRYDRSAEAIKVHSRGQIALVVASSGIAATLLSDGVTAHSRFKILLDVDHSSTCMVKKGTTLAELLKSVTLIVWDEAPMIGSKYHNISYKSPLSSQFSQLLQV
ncbi:hypothetical protein LINPERPRIM_LOCUS2550 [Linum perenne]